MKDETLPASRGILFSAPMVLALRSGRKTQTRRLKPIFGVKPGDQFYVRETFAPRAMERVRGHHGSTLKVSKEVPKIKDADLVLLPDGSRIHRNGKMTGPIANTAQLEFETRGVKWSPTIHMPRWASRVTLTVTRVWQERLHDMSNADARAEGVDMESADPPFYWVPGLDTALTGVETIEGERASYAKLWDLLHKAKGTTWAANPMVAAYEFEVRLGNIDRGGGR